MKKSDATPWGLFLVAVMNGCSMAALDQKDPKERKQIPDPIAVDLTYARNPKNGCDVLTSVKIDFVEFPERYTVEQKQICLKGSNPDITTYQYWCNASAMPYGGRKDTGKAIIPINLGNMDFGGIGACKAGYNYIKGLLYQSPPL